MGAIWGRRIEMVTTLSEQVGYKAGVALSRDQMSEFLGDLEGGFINGPDDDTIRIRAEEYDECLCQLLYSVGNIRSPCIMSSISQLYHEVKHDEKLLAIYLKLGEDLVAFLSSALHIPKESPSDSSSDRYDPRGQPVSPIAAALSISMSSAAAEVEATVQGTKSINPKPFVERARKNYGKTGAAMALAMVQGFNEDLHKSSLSDFRGVEWSDVADLKDLFRSEKLETHHGEFFDQRFVDYLSHNFNSIDAINWRKFEGLTCEFFYRLGLDVEIGKGRDDDSVDARIWTKTKKKQQSPLILVQCKREKAKVGKVVVKALHADVAHEKAKLGLIVTTSALSPGAKKVCSARRYPLIEANRDTLKKWVAAMRTPYTGVFLGE